MQSSKAKLVVLVAAVAMTSPNTGLTDGNCGPQDFAVAAR